MKQINDMTKSGSISEQYKAAILAAVKAQQLTTQQAIDKIEYQKEWRINTESIISERMING